MSPESGGRYLDLAPGRLGTPAGLPGEGLPPLGLVSLWQATGEDRHRETLDRLFAAGMDAAGTRAGTAPALIDLVRAAMLSRTGPLPLPVRAASDLAAGTLREQPRLAAGVMARLPGEPGAITLDWLAAALPFQALHGLRGSAPRLISDAFDQMTAAMKLLVDDGTGLVHGGYDEARAAPWADPASGLSAAFLARDNGLIGLALTDLADVARETSMLPHRFDETIRDLADSLIERQSDDGRFPLVLARGGLAGNVLETSGSLAISAFLMKGARLGILSPRHARAGRRAFAAVERHALQADGRGGLMLATCTAFGSLSPGHDGTPERHCADPVVADTPAAIGALMLAMAELARVAPVAEGE